MANDVSRRAMRGGCGGSLVGMFGGAALGLLLGITACGNAPTEKPSDDGQRETVRHIQQGLNTGAKILAGFCGTILGGMFGAILGAGLGARAASGAAIDRTDEGPADSASG